MADCSGCIPIAATQNTVVPLVPAWRAAGAVEAIVELPSPIDDETIELLAAPVRERLG